MKTETSNGVIVISLCALVLGVMLLLSSAPPSARSMVKGLQTSQDALAGRVVDVERTDGYEAASLSKLADGQTSLFGSVAALEAKPTATIGPVLAYCYGSVPANGSEFSTLCSK